MKKSIILGTMLLSTVAFAKGYNQNNENANYQNYGRMANKYANLSEEQIAKLQSLRAEHFKETQDEILEIEGLGLEIEKLLIEENVDWKAVELKINEAGEVEVSLEMEKLQNREEVKDILGDDAAMLGLGRKENRGRANNEVKVEFYVSNGKNKKDNEFKEKGNKEEGRKFKGNKDDDEGKGKQSNRDNNEKRGKGFNRNSDLTDEQIAQVNEIKEENNRLREKLRLDIALSDNAIKKLLIADDIDWNAVETKLEEKVTYVNQLRLANFQAAEKIEDITGKSMSGFAKRGNMGFGSKDMGNRKGEWK